MAKIRNMDEFAAVSGISRPTVSKYFNDPESVRRSTRDRIEAALELHDYRPNVFAMNQNRRLTKNVGIVVPYLSDPFFAEVARRIERRAIKAGFTPLLFSPYGHPEIEVEILDNLRSLKPAGVMLAPLGRASDKRMLEKFCREVPTVLFDSRMEEIERPFVGTDNAQVTRLMVEYLCRSGQPPTFFEMRSPANPNAKRRRNGYIAAMEAAGHTPRVHSVDGTGWNFEEIGAREGRALLLRDALETDTILCSNDRLAIGLLSAAYELGRKVGHSGGADLRIAGMDDHPFSRFTCPALTTVAQNYRAIVQETVQQLRQLVEDEAGATPAGQTLFEGQLIMRASA